MPVNKSLSSVSRRALLGPGVIVDYSPARTGVYIGSPSLAVLPNGDLVASHDDFGPRSTLARTYLFASSDHGRTWAALATVENQYWSTLFVHEGALYLIGTTREYGFVSVRRSGDGGRTWTTARDRDTGLLLSDGKYHCAPVPVVTHAGRLWRAMEDAQGPGGWGSHFRAFMLSIPSGADLLKADNWTFSNRLARNPSWLGGRFGGWLEGNAVATREGTMVDLLRADYPGYEEKAAILTISADGKTAGFDPASGFIDFPGGGKKFTVRFDRATNAYWSLTNYVPDSLRSAPGSVRCTLALVCSTDLRHWEVRAVLLHHPDPARHGFQYADWLFDGEDIVAVLRTAGDDNEGGARGYHDANYLTFHRFANFRRLRTGTALPTAPPEGRG